MTVEWLGDGTLRIYLGPSRLGILYVEISRRGGDTVVRRLVAYGKHGKKTVLSYEKYSLEQFSLAVEAMREFVWTAKKRRSPGEIIVRLKGLIDALEAELGGGL